MPHVPAIFQFPLAIPFWIVFFLAFVREGKIVRPALGEKGSAQDGGTFRALMIGSPLALLAAAAAAYSPWLIIPFPIGAMALGAVLIAGGAVLRRYCFNALGASFTGKVIVEAGQRVIQSGVYRFVRHPSYTAAFLMYCGTGVALGSWISVAILFLVHCYLYGRRVAVEEAALVETLGEPYVEYMARTKRFIPFLI
jgi:protein-S-isoprenylcysteine O-methyltransferase Ste14